MRQLAELVVRENDAVPVVVLDVIEDADAVFGREVFLARIEKPGIGIGRAESFGYLVHVGFQSDDKRLFRQAQPVHFICRHTHNECFSGADFVVADTPAIELEHSYGVFLAPVQGVYSQTFQVEAGE